MRGFLIFTTVVYGFFGLGLLAIPAPFLSPYGISVDMGGQLMCRILGAALLGFAWVFWSVRSAKREGAMLAVLRGSFVYNAIDTVVLLIAMNRGELGVLSWGPIGLHIVMALGFGWFGLRRG
ncbi:hypothetical protein QO010_000571 [Caulobacter ginsengisoli]|uniref:Uncharacterized protein n=1 Tax=Caulobacter ginsengisoli TaxID=400775 RepID=A0ABU0INS2_9CAUL|nr:hypothetical protein [Caulobacter ginsengisoli]MDQ0462823.1 hypothetical protein [Caulobacter ginsengisoli]